MTCRHHMQAEVTTHKSFSHSAPHAVRAAHVCRGHFLHWWGCSGRGQIHIVLGSLMRSAHQQVQPPLTLAEGFVEGLTTFQTDPKPWHLWGSAGPPGQEMCHEEDPFQAAGHRILSQVAHGTCHNLLQGHAAGNLSILDHQIKALCQGKSCIV